MKILRTSHDKLYRMHHCPSCNKYWTYCNPCGLVLKDNTYDHSGQYYGPLIRCDCGEPFWIAHEDYYEEECPSCEKWFSLGEYREWIED